MSFTKPEVGLHNILHFRQKRIEPRPRVIRIENFVTFGHELRRLRADLVTCYKIINGLLDIPFDSFLGWLITAVHAVTH